MSAQYNRVTKTHTLFTNKEIVEQERLELLDLVREPAIIEVDGHYDLEALSDEDLEYIDRESEAAMLDDYLASQLPMPVEAAFY